jgi:hypothetical protein
MTRPDPLHDPVAAPVEAANALSHAAGTRGSHMAAADSVDSLREARSEVPR